MDWKIAASSFALVFVAELPGKTTFATLLMAARGEPWPVFLGAAGAFVLHTAIAVSAGAFLSGLPARPLQLAVGALFLVLAVLLWREEASGLEKNTPRGAASAFGLIFVAQWGDPSQLATAALAAKYGA